jgi:hypothetical protein
MQEYHVSTKKKEIAMPSDNTTRLRQAYLAASAAAGKPLTRIGERGQRYRRPDGKIVLIRTCKRRNVLANSVGYTPNDPIDIEGRQDFVGLAVPGRRRAPDEFYEVPDPVVIDGLRAGMAEWCPDHPNGKSKVRQISFDGDPQSAITGYAEKWGHYRLAQPLAIPAPASDVRANAVVQARRMVATAFAVPESTVRIAINLIT